MEVWRGVGQGRQYRQAGVFGRKERRDSFNSMSVQEGDSKK